MGENPVQVSAVLPAILTQASCTRFFRQVMKSAGKTKHLWDHNDKNNPDVIPASQLKENLSTRTGRSDLM
jgi:hypothetical protein